MSNIESAAERAILDQLRQAQDAHHGGNQRAASALVDDLLTRYGRESVDAVRRRQARDQLDADLNLYSMFGVAGLIGDD
ncbi:hypothetical protein [Nocardia vermiculata]|uniref:Uncharacterized protein n=1 Tax=Nocardia vermiculata TaxID=257274 RepID=A0A846Y864_9NOCA|nr:hypothetical protein [Nocardia vermiculata]NKY53931.1 hypothetical protein [Nocardia vermiculata]